MNEFELLLDYNTSPACANFLQKEKEEKKKYYTSSFYLEIAEKILCQIKETSALNEKIRISYL